MTDNTPLQQWWVPAIEMFIRVSAWIAGPIVVSLFLGRYLDMRYGTEPWIFLGMTALAFAVSTIGIVRETFSYMRAVDEQNQKDKSEVKKKDT